MTVMAAYDFDPKQIQSVLDAAAQHAKSANIASVSAETDVSNGGALVLAAGVSASRSTTDRSASICR
jgi:hypothetical protein